MNRVIITDYGVVSPIGNGADGLLNNLKGGTNDIASIIEFGVSETGITLAGEVKNFPYDRYFIKENSERTDTFSVYGIYAALEAMGMSSLDKEKMNRDRFDVITESGIGGLPAVESQVIRLHEKDTRRASPVFVPVTIANITAGNVVLRVGTKGICITIVTVYTSGTGSIRETFRNIKHDYSGVTLARGTEATICEMGIAGFAALTALSESTDPNRGSTSSDENRNGFVMGGGVDVLAFESLEHVQTCSTRIYGEAVGYGANCGAYHMTTPTSDGSGISKAAKLATEETGMQSEQVECINAHGANTPVNDQAGTRAVRIALGEDFRDTYVSSTKSMTGRLLGAADGIKILATLLVLERQFIPPAVNVEKQNSEIDLTVVKSKGKPISLTYTMNNSLGFGGHNAALCIKRWEE